MANLAGLGGFLQGLAGGMQQSIDNRLKAQESANRKRQLEAFLQSQEFQMKATQKRLEQEEKQEDRLARSADIAAQTNALRAAQYIRSQNPQAINRAQAGTGTEADMALYRMYQSFEKQGLGVSEMTTPAVPPVPYQSVSATPSKGAEEKPTGDLVGGASKERQPTPEAALEESRELNNEYTARVLGISHNDRDSTGAYVVEDAVYEDMRAQAMQENAERGSNVSVIARSVHDAQSRGETQRVARKIFHLAEDRLAGTPFTWGGVEIARDEKGNVLEVGEVEDEAVDPLRHMLYLKTREGGELTPRNLVPSIRALTSFMYDLETPEEKRTFARMVAREVLPTIENSMRELAQSGAVYRDKEDPGRMIAHGLRETPGTFKEGEELYPAMGLEDAVSLTTFIDDIRSHAPGEVMAPIFRVDTPQNDREWAESFIAASKPLLPSLRDNIPVMSEVIENYLEQGGPITEESKRIVRSFLEQNDLEKKIVEVPLLTKMFTPADRWINKRYTMLVKELRSRVGAR